jgi:hypothetical protein
MTTRSDTLCSADWDVLAGAKGSGLRVTAR